MPKRTYHTTPEEVLQPEALGDGRWETEIVPRLPSELESQARKLNVFVRVREVKCVSDLLRALLAELLAVPEQANWLEGRIHGPVLLVDATRLRELGGCGYRRSVATVRASKADGVFRVTPAVFRWKMSTSIPLRCSGGCDGPKCRRRKRRGRPSRKRRSSWQAGCC
jgi:hypothetical protein